MNSRPAPLPKWRVHLRGMTLIELMVVMAIMLALLALAASSFQSFGRSTEMTNGIQHVADALNVARQIAVSRNEYTQVRIYGAPDTDFRAGQFTALAVFRADAPYYTNDYTTLLSSRRMRQEGNITRLPQSCIIASNAPYSPLIQTLASDPIRQISLADGTKGLAFYFKPDGSLDIPATNGSGPAVNALSICAMQAFIGAGNKLPANYGIINIDRINGRFQIVRP